MTKVNYEFIRDIDEAKGKVVESIDFSWDNSTVVIKFTDKTYTYIEGSADELYPPFSQLDIWQRDSLNLLAEGVMEEFEKAKEEERLKRVEASELATWQRLNKKFGGKDTSK